MTMQSSQPEFSRLSLQRSPNQAISTSSSSISRNSLDYSLPSGSNMNTAISATSQHHKRPSASSISSTSSTSNSSKTAAFFNASFDNPIKPATSSNASIAPASKQSSPQKVTVFTHNQLAKNDDTNTSAGQRISMEETGNTSLTSVGLNSFGGGEQLGRTSSSTRRSWVDFEGRPIYALPSPGLSDEDGEKPEMNRFIFPDSTDSDMPSRLSSHPSLPSIATNVASSRDLSSEIVDSPKTLNFFGTGTSSAQPAIFSAKEGNRMKYPSAALTATPPRHPSDSGSLHAPSRFPSAVADHPCPGNEQDGQSSTSDFNQDHSMGSSQSTPRLVLGTQPIVPSAFVSPPSPDPNEGFQSQRFNSSPTRNGFSRHTHGPSENVTDSSIVPPAEAMQLMDKATDVYRANANSQASMSNSNEHLRDSKPSPSPQSTPTIEESEDESANKVGSYSVERVLGMGAFSKVVLARRQRVNQSLTGANAASSVHGQLGDLVALKMLEKEPCRQNERMRVSWVREVEVLRHIVHPNIVRFLSSFSTSRHHVLVLETVEGGELFEFLAQSQLEIANREWLVRRMFGELANAVGWMHTINLVHRDIKLENIILTQTLRGRNDLTPANLPDTPLIKLSDFGLSRFIDPNAPLLETRCGSEEYAAPELIIGKRYDGRLTDVWAMGVVLYALLSGSLPFLDFADTSSQGQGMINAREDAGPNYQTDPRARKQHLLRIAKGDLRWPQFTNDECMDVVDGRNCIPLHRLITPPARLLVARLLRRDSSKRINAWEIWDDDWMLKGSFSDANGGKGETSLRGHTFTISSDPRSTEGQAWLNAHARVQAGAPDVVRDD